MYHHEMAHITKEIHHMQGKLRACVSNLAADGLIPSQYRPVQAVLSDLSHLLFYVRNHENPNEED